MQRGGVSYDSSSAVDKSPAASLQFSSSNPFFSPTSPTYINSDASFYSTLFQNYSTSSTSDTASFDGGDTDLRLEDASGLIEYQQLYNRYTLCLAQLHDSIEEADDLRRENDSLRLSNADLSRRIALLFSRDRLLSDFSSLNVASLSPSLPRATHLVPTQLFSEHNRVERRNNGGVTVPKNISVRASGFPKTTRPGPDIGNETVWREQQRAYEGGEEVDVYEQGMWKTELCNKWQETGLCQYGDNCQFAHGIKELRPRYKTHAVDNCPYDHRCHFRQALAHHHRHDFNS